MRGHYAVSAPENTEKVLTVIANVIDKNLADKECLQRLLTVYADIRAHRVAQIQGSKTMLDIIAFIDSSPQQV